MAHQPEGGQPRIGTSRTCFLFPQRMFGLTVPLTACGLHPNVAWVHFLLRKSPGFDPCAKALPVAYGAEHRKRIQSLNAMCFYKPERLPPAFFMPRIGIAARCLRCGQGLPMGTAGKRLRRAFCGKTDADARTVIGGALPRRRFLRTVQPRPRFPAGFRKMEFAFFQLFLMRY